MLGSNRLVFDSTDVDYSNLSLLILSTNDNNNSHLPLEGELGLKFTGTTILRSWTDINIMFNEPSISILGNPSLITCSKANRIDVRRAKELLNNLTRLASPTKPKFVHNVGPGDTGGSDSGDEGVPLTPERPPLFTSEELSVIQHCLGLAWTHYQRATSGHFSNGPGKFFMDYLATYLGLASASTSTRFESSHSTTSGGSGSIGDKDTQAGSSTITPILLSKHATRVARSRFACQSQIKRYSDVSTFDHLKGIYTTSGELKSTLDSADFQNLEQMLGLWRSNQNFFLGWTVNPEHIHCRILVKQQGLHLYQLQETNSIGSIIFLAELYLASILIVDSTC